MKVRNDSPQATVDGLYVPALRPYLGDEAIWKHGDVIDVPDEIAATLVNHEHPAVDKDGKPLDVTFTTADDGKVTAHIAKPAKTEES